MNKRLHFFLIRATSDAGFGMGQAVVPLLALKFGATAMMLGTIGWVAMAIRFPFCLTAGRLSERFGRKAVSIPAAFILMLSLLGLTIAPSLVWVLIFYTVCAVCNGIFYPPVMALIGDVSPRGTLRKNLAIFNLGWCGGLASVAFVLAWLVGIGIKTPFYVSAGLLFVTTMLVIFLPSDKVQTEPDEEDTAPTGCDPRILIISRMGHFIGFVSLSVIRILYPKLGESLGWTDKQIAWTTAFLLGGLAAGLLVSNLGSWWRNRLWPQIAAQTIMFLAAGVAVMTSTREVFAVAFAIIGVAFGVANTSALYHGLSGRRERGKNTGIHEALVSAANIAGCLIGGLLAKAFDDPRAPLYWLCTLAGLAIAASLIVYYGGFFKKADVGY